jgi:hypothetical protein
MKVYIDTTDVLRNTFLKSEQLYKKFYIEELSEVDKFESLDGEWTKDENSEFEYELNLPITSYDLINHFKFPTQEDLFNFFYEDFPMQIFGNSPTMSSDTFKILNELYEKNREKIDFSIISEELQKSKPATLFFLAKNSCLLENIRFYSNHTVYDLIDSSDIIVTANPTILNLVPGSRNIIKVETTYNENYDFTNKIKSLEELESKLNELNII